MRIGLFGGTFNPVHEGHLRIALEVKAAFRLDKIHLIPSFLPPHKKPAGVASAEYRLEMIRLSLGDRTGLTVSEVELKRSGPSYTIDTVRNFLSARPDNMKLYLIMGLDAFLEIDSWKSHQDIFRLVPIIVMARPGNADDVGQKRWEPVKEYLGKTVSNDRRLIKKFHYRIVSSG